MFNKSFGTPFGGGTGGFGAASTFGQQSKFSSLRVSNRPIRSPESPAVISCLSSFLQTPEASGRREVLGRRRSGRPATPEDCLAPRRTNPVGQPGWFRSADSARVFILTLLLSRWPFWLQHLQPAGRLVHQRRLRVRRPERHVGQPVWQHGHRNQRRTLLPAEQCLQRQQTHDVWK